MEEEYVYEFIYSDCIHEGAAATISIHRTQKGAEMAMEFHKEAIRKEFEECAEREPSIYDSKFDDSRSWDVVKTKLKQ